MQDIYSLSLTDIAPPNIASDHEVSSIITALDPQLQELSRDSLQPLILARIDELPEPVLDLLAWQLHADFYDLAGTIDMKREAVKSSILWHMHKGTEWAIHEALRQIDIRAEFVPWWDDDSDPYTFKLRAIVSGDFYRTQGRDKLQSSIRRAVNESKAARSLLAGLETRIEFREDIGLYVGVVPVLTGQYSMKLAKPEAPGTTSLYVGIASGLQGQKRILLPHEQDITTPIYIAPISIENRDVELGVDLNLMQELLARFEARILARIDTFQLNIQKQIDLTQQETNARLDEILDMLRWKGNDEPLP